MHRKGIKGGAFVVALVLVTLLLSIKSVQSSSWFGIDFNKLKAKFKFFGHKKMENKGALLALNLNPKFEEETEMMDKNSTLAMLKKDDILVRPMIFPCPIGKIYSKRRSKCVGVLLKQPFG